MWSDKNRESVPGAGGEREIPLDEAGRVRAVAVIGNGMVIKGEIKSTESLHIDGEVEGKLDLSEHRLTIGRDGRVGADATAREIELLGTVRGNLEATKRITIRKGARLIGDLRAPGILIEEGAYIKGKIEIINTADEAKVSPMHPNVKKSAAGA